MEKPKTRTSTRQNSKIDGKKNLQPDFSVAGFHGIGVVITLAGNIGNEKISIYLQLIFLQ